MNFRQHLLDATTEEDFKNVLLKHAQELADEQSNPDKRLLENHVSMRYDEVSDKVETVIGPTFFRAFSNGDITNFFFSIFVFNFFLTI